MACLLNLLWSIGTPEVLRAKSFAQPRSLARILLALRAKLEAVVPRFWLSTALDRANREAGSN
jgi:hypothetical protein